MSNLGTEDNPHPNKKGIKLNLENHTAIFCVDTATKLYTSLGGGFGPPMIMPGDEFSIESSSKETYPIFSMKDKEIFMELVNELYLFIKTADDIIE